MCRSAICARSSPIPPRPADIDDATIQAALDTVALGHLGHPVRRGGRLGQGALAGRAAADRVRACAADQTEGGVPRRVDVGARRGAGVRAVPSAAHRVAGLHRGQRQPPPHRRAAPRAASANCSAAASGGSAGSASTTLKCLATTPMNMEHCARFCVCSRREINATRRVLACAPAEERALTELRSAGVALAVLGDVRRACAGGVQARNRRCRPRAALRRRWRWPVRPR